jgi:hypothetical protein
MDFGTAMKLMFAGKKIRRIVWTDQGKWVELDLPRPNSYTQRPYLFQRTNWRPTEADFEASDWEQVC